MEDSPTNPYIPQASGKLQAKVQRQQTPFARISKTVLICGGVLIVLLGIALYFIIPRASVVDDKARADLANTLQPSAKLSKLITIQSNLGFTTSYQDQLFTSYGEVGSAHITAQGVSDQVGTEHYENNDLKQKRGYGLIRITPLESTDTSRAAITLPPELEIRSYDKASLLTTDEAKAATAGTGTDKTNGNATPKGEIALSTFVAIDSKKRMGQTTADDSTTVTIESTKPANQNINGADYQKVRYTTHNNNYRISTENYDDCYYTIQNSQAYSACVVNVRPDSVAAASLLEDTIGMITYQEPVVPGKVDTTKPVSYQPVYLASSLPLSAHVVLAQAATTPPQPDSTDTSNTPEDTITPQIKLTPAYVKDENALKAIAKNQPSVMRIGTLYCADIALKLADGTTGTTLTDACAGNISTGAFISKDGYIATAGHAVRYDPKAAINGYINFASSRADMFDRLGRVLDYLLKSGVIYQTDVDYLKTGANTGNQDALAKIENLGSVIQNKYIQAANETYVYAIQPTDKPIVLDLSSGNKPKFAYSDAVIPAKFVMADYDASKSAQEAFGTQASATDVALLKADGSFPVVTIGAGDGIKANQKLSIIGYPAYVDSSLTIDKILNIPVATSSMVNQTFQQDGHPLIETNEPILPGNDGAPTFDETGKFVGLGVYGHSYCPDQHCFDSGTVRSINELSAMIDKNNLVLTNKSDISDIWAQGVDAYFKGDYRVANAKFAQSGSMYSFNQSASKLADLSATKYGSTSDTSLMNQLVTIAIGVIIVTVVAMIILGILLLIHLRRLDTLQVGHYGAQTFQPAAMPVMAAPVPQQYPQQPGQFGPPAVQQAPTPMQQPQMVQPQQPFTPGPQPSQPVLPQDPTPPPQDPFYRQ